MSGRRHILVVDRDAIFRSGLAEQLGLDGNYSAAEAASIAEAEAKLTDEKQPFDALILEVASPDGDGVDLCTRLRRTNWCNPIIMLGASNEEAAVVRGLQAGANDYIAKPVRVGELLARVRAQLRTFDNSEHGTLRIGPYASHSSARLLRDTVRGRRIFLTEKEAAILKFLYRAGMTSVPRQVLLSAVWGYNAAVDTHTLETHIYRLRQKIELEPAHPKLLVTEGDGYRLQSGGLPNAKS